jgi:hypothetical protein
VSSVPSAGATFLTDAVRSQIAMLADHVVPAAAGRPSASEIGVHTQYIDIALAARPDLTTPLATVLARLPDDLSEVVEETLHEVVELIIACYFMSPIARRSIGYRGQSPIPIAGGEAEYYLEEDDVLAPVLSLGRRWRATPDDAA